MFDLLLELFRHAITMFFGTFLSAVFLNIEMKPKNVWILCSFTCVDLAVQAGIFALKGLEFSTMAYPLLAHVPLLFLFILVFKKKWYHGIFAITTTYLCCQIANWVSIISITLHASGIVIDAIYTLALGVTFVFIQKYATMSFINLYAKPAASFLSFAIVPGFYYVFDYLSTVYSEQLYENNLLAVEFTPFLLCLCYMFFCTVYFRQYEEKLEVEQHNRFMHIQQIQSEKEINAIKHSEQTISLLRHDLRHFLTTISEYLEQNQTDRAKEYIGEIIDVADETKQKKYCANDTVNMILSYYEETLQHWRVHFDYELKVSSAIEISDVDITSILSNGLENAIHAVRSLPEEKRIIQLQMIEKNGKLLISIKNTYGDTPHFDGDMPVSKKDGHGFGTQSIQYTAEKLGGNCHFSLKGDYFVLQLIL